MSFAIHHAEPCGICRNECIDEGEFRSGYLGCTVCQEFFFVCGHCSGATCPNCGTGLRKKKEIFPHNLFSMIKENRLEDISQILSTTPCDIAEIKDDSGRPMLFIAAIEQNHELCELLIDQHRASVHTIDSAGRTALIEMVRTRSKKWPPKIADLFSSTVNHQDRDGRTALMFAAEGAGLFGSKRGNIGIASQLLEMGADVTLTDRRGNTALGHAMKNNEASPTSNNEEMVAFLKQEIISQVALREFHNKYDHEITNDGVLRFRPKIS